MRREEIEREREREMFVLEWFSFLWNDTFKEINFEEENPSVHLRFLSAGSTLGRKTTKGYVH